MKTRNKQKRLTRKEKWVAAKVIGLSIAAGTAFYTAIYLNENPKANNKKPIETEIPFFTHDNENLVAENYEDGVYKRLEEVNEPRRIFLPRGNIDTIENAYILTVGERSGIMGIDYNKDTTIDEYVTAGTFPENHEYRTRTGIKKELSKIEKELLERK
jgi:hypothetical protein